MTGTRKTGNARRWDATRGFGFIRGPGDGADVFFHVRDWRGAALPHEGMTVDFEEIHVGGKGPRAMAVQEQRAANKASRPTTNATTTHDRSRQRPHPVRSHRATRGAAPPRNPVWWWLAFFVWVGALAAGVHLQRVPLWALGALLAVNVWTFFAYMFDKSSAERNARRTPENTLHTCALIGGWPGARLAQNMFRHKSSKQSFQSAYAVTVLLNVAGLLAWLYWGPRWLIA